MKAIPLSAVRPPVRRRRSRRAIATTLVAVLAVNLLQVPALARPAAGHVAPTPQPVPAVPVSPVNAGKPTAATPMRPASAQPAPAWPAAGSAMVDVPPAPASRPARAGALPVLVAATAGRATSGVVPGRVRVEVLDRAATVRAGVQGMLLRVASVDGAPTESAVRIVVDYGGFATAYGADWASRLRLVSLPGCALSTPEKRQCSGVALPSRNDLAARTVSAAVPVGAGDAVVAVSAGSSGPAGDFAGTSLQSSSTWSAGGSSGAFNWSYPMRVPPALGGPVPEVALSYSSQSVDGRHAASNNQPSWVGEGFEARVGGFIERRYRPCAKDMDGVANNTDKTGDLCWETDNATLSLSGRSGELIYNSSEGRWHLRGDEGSRIEHKTGASNGDNNGEYWVVTTTDGTQYWFGINRLPGWTTGNPVTDSTWTAPVFGNDPGEPCHATAFADSDCVQAWRWNLDYVIDVHQNSASYWYAKETNKYGRNLDPNDAASYDRGGWLDHVDYGTRQSAGTDSVLSAPAPAQVVFGVADRCLSSCTIHDAAHWPDTPWDSECTGTSCTDDFSPTFWSSKRLSTVTTRVRDGSSYGDVERWTLTHQFPDPGDGTRAGLWLAKISHAGLVGSTTTVPDVEITGTQLANRVDTTDFAAAMNWWRIAMIRNESGGTINVTYSAPDCVAGQTPTPHTNTRRCYPVIWKPEGYLDPVTDWFHKYVVTTIYETDNTGGAPPAGSPRTVYSYSYLDGAAWHYSDDDGLIDKAEKTWSDFRGYGRVGVTVGDPGEQTYTETRYFRGMHGDKASPTGGTRIVTVDGIADEDWYSGAVREAKVFNGPGGPVASRETSDPWPSPATATRTINGDTVTARFKRIATVRTYTALDAGRGERVTKTTTDFDQYGMAISVDDFGQDGVAGDEQCTQVDYSPRNTTNWLMDRVHRTQIHAVGCAATGGSLGEDDVIGEIRTSYDDHTYGTEPTRGLVTRTEEMASWNNGAPTFTTVARAAYDTYGRLTSSWDAMNYETKTAYTPATGGPVTSMIVTNPLLHVTTATVEPAWGATTSTVDPNGKRTDFGYDGLGRLTSVWLPGRDRATQTANLTFGYTIRNDATTVISGSRLNAAGNYVTSYALYDGLLRARQTQGPSPSGGRLLTDTFYDSAGRPVKTFGAYHATGNPGTTLVTATERQMVPTQTRTVYDGASRATASVFQPYDVERWRTSTYYAGDRVDVTPPSGGTATSTVTDARGRVVELRQYRGTTPTPGTAGSWDATSYTFNRKGQLTAVTDAAGNDWTFTFDIRGRQTQTTDPDSGTSVFTFDNAGRLSTATDGRGKKLAYLYDSLNRKRAVYDNQVGGTMRAQWVFDTIAKGELTQTTRFVAGGASYQVKVIGYTDRYQPTGTQIVIPTSETGLSGTYNSFNTWNLDGSLASSSLDSTNTDLPTETVSYGYSDLGLPTTLKALIGGVNAHYVPGTVYNALGQLDQITLDTDDTAGGRVWQAFTRELETGRLTGVRTDRDTVAPYTLIDQRYTFDDAGNITRTVDVAADPVDDTQCFGYDHLRRLTNAWTPSSGDCAASPIVNGLGGPAPYWHSWTFDAAGNRRTQTVHTADGDNITTYNYPDSGNPQPHTLISTSGAQTGAYSYDAAGNTLTRPTTSSGTQQLTWDPEGNLETSLDTTGETRYIYDADGNRLVRRDPTGKTLYLPGQEIRYNASTATTACTRYYNFAGQTVASRTAGGLNWLGIDHQNTALVAVDAQTQAAVIRRQTPYGALRGTAATWPNDKGFVGGTNEPTGLVHLGAREYDNALGRFVSVDPLMDLADPQHWNGYAYANNNPITLSDPSGLSPEDAQWEEKHPGQDDASSDLGWDRYGCPDNDCSARDEGTGLPIRDEVYTGKNGTVLTVDSLGNYYLNGYRLPPADFDPVRLAVILDENRSDVRMPDENSSDPVRRLWSLLTEIVAACAQIRECSRTDGEFYIGVDNDRQAAVELFNSGRSSSFTWQQVLIEVGTVAVAVIGTNRIGGVRGGGCRSFSADTEVLMADGTTKPISEIKIGDKVLAADPETGEQGARVVTHLWIHEDTLVALSVAGERLTTTEDHLYWNATDQQWQRADGLDRGDLLLTPTGAGVPVGGLLPGPRSGTAYNLTVDDIHTYYVMAGTTPVLVHNDNGGWTPSAATKVMRGGPFGATYYQMPPDRLGNVYWWSRDMAGHGAKGEAQWKIFTETKTGLEWYADADKNGTYIQGKHKGGTGLKVPFRTLKSVNVTPGSFC